MTQRGETSGTEDAADPAREARGSVHEAIGKLIGDDAECAHGAAEQRAAKTNAKPPSGA